MALMDYLSARREQIEAQIKALRSELTEIKIAEAALSGGSPGDHLVMTVYPGGMTIRPGSIKDWIVKALTAFPDGLETDSVIEAIRHMGGPFFGRSSTTPQLSRLKAAGLIEYNGRHWRLPLKGAPKKNETPGVQPPDASEDEDFSDLA
jgi:hypothetical protein